MLNGKGVYILPDGAYYEGGFKNNKFDGKGLERGDKYTFKGTFIDGARSKGLLKWDAEDGEYIYEGTFNSQNQFHGKGINEVR